MQGESKQLCAETPLFPHTLGGWEPSLRLILLINPRIEPRASLSGTLSAGDSVPGSTPLTDMQEGVPRDVQ